MRKPPNYHLHKFGSVLLGSDGSTGRKGVGSDDPLQRTLIEAQVIFDGWECDGAHAQVCDNDEESWASSPHQSRVVSHTIANLTHRSNLLCVGVCNK